MTDARAVIHRAISEAEMQRTIVTVARTHGWRVHHDPPVRSIDEAGHIRHRTALHGDPGFPDLVLARAGDVIIVECKRERGARWRPGQREWIAAIGARVVTPSTMDSLLLRLRMPVRPQHPHVWKRYGGAPADGTGRAFCDCGWRRLEDGTLRSGMDADRDPPR